MALCGAKNRSGKPCQKKTMPNGRCYFHGGKSTGPPRGSQNHRTHGIYAKAITPAEQQQLPDIIASMGSLEQEIIIAKVALIRVITRMRQCEEGDIEPLDRIEVITETSGDLVVCQSLNKIPKKRVTQRRPDLYGILDKLLGRIGRLTEQQTRIVEIETLYRELENLKEQLNMN